MPRKKTASFARLVTPDPKYSSTIVESICRKIMIDGKKAKAQSIVWKAMEMIEAETSTDPVSVLEAAIANLTPINTLRRTKVGGANHQVPVLASSRKGSIIATRFLIKAVRARGERSFSERFVKEVIDASRKLGIAYKEIEGHKKTVEANRAFAR